MATDTKENKQQIKDEFIKIKMNHGFNVDLRSDSEIAEEKEYVANLKRTDRKSYNEMLKTGSDYPKCFAEKDELIEVSKTWYEAYKDKMVEVPVHLNIKAYKRADGGAFPVNVQEAIEHGHLKDDKTTLRIKLFEKV